MMGKSKPTKMLSEKKVLPCPMCGDQEVGEDTTIYTCAVCEDEGMICCIPGVNAKCVNCEEAE